LGITETDIERSDVRIGEGEAAETIARASPFGSKLTRDAKKKKELETTACPSI